MVHLPGGVRPDRLAGAARLAEALAALFEYLFIALFAMLVIVNPLTTAVVFLSLLPRAAAERRKGVARRATAVAGGVFVAFATLGGVIFQVFGVTLAAFRIAGGLILFGIALSMIRAPTAPGPEDREAKRDGAFTDDVAIVPLAIPFISGPGAIATVMILTSEAPTVYHLGLVYLAIGVATVACYYAMVHSTRVVHYLGESGQSILTRLFGLILAVIAVQFVINGVLEVVHGLGTPDSAPMVV